MQDNVEIFKRWMMYQLKDRQLSFSWQQNCLEFRPGQQDGRIIFYDHQLIEEVIYENDQVTFYLYYVFENYLYACQMFQAMMQAMHTKQAMKHVLLCCSGGLTSAFFMTKMRRYLTLNHIMMDIEAGAISEIDELGKSADLILIAPQMRYCLEKLQSRYPEKFIAAIPAGIFAAYDCHGLYLFIISQISCEATAKKVE